MKAPSSCVGVEIELEKTQRMALPAGYERDVEVKYDGSLRNEGKEYVSLPVQPKRAAEIVRAIVDKAKSCHAVASSRTGFHVHVGASNISPFARQRLFVCGLVADAYGRAFWPERVGNAYCDPSRFTQHATRLSETHWTKPSEQFALTARYSPINVAAYTRHGTFEFRRGAMYDSMGDGINESLDPSWEKQIAYMGLVAASKRLSVDRLARKYANEAYQAVLKQKIEDNAEMLMALAGGVADVACDLISEYPESVAHIEGTEIAIAYA